MKTKISKVHRKFKQFSKHCTLHGVYYFYSNSSWCIHLVWCVLIACSVSLCAYLSHMIWRKFVDNPTFTVVESTHYPVDRISFPAISVCDSEAIYGPSTDNISKILMLRGYSKDNLTAFYSSFTKMKNKGYIQDIIVKRMHLTLRELGYNYNDLLDMLKKPCEVLIKECLWRSRPTNCSLMFRSVFTVTGYCCQFDIEYLRKNAPNNTNFRTGVEISEGLDVIVNSGQVLPNGSSVRNTISLYVFDEAENLTLLDGSITLTPATYFDVTVDAWVIDSSDDVKALKVSDRMCFLPSDKTIAKSYQGCMATLILRKVVEYCRCIPFKYNSKDLDVKNYPICTWERLSCIYEMLEQYQTNIRDIITENECYQKCDYVQYETEADYFKMPVTSLNYDVKIAVHFNDITCIKYRREVLYTWDQMLANLGGIFGLCLGGSIISVIEILSFLFEIIFEACDHRRVPKKNTAFTKSPHPFVN